MASPSKKTSLQLRPKAAVAPESPPVKPLEPLTPELPAQGKVYSVGKTFPALDCKTYCVWVKTKKGLKRYNISGIRLTLEEATALQKKLEEGL